LLTINGPRHYLWQAVDQDGHALDLFAQRRRDKRAAKKFIRKRLKGLTYVPRVLMMDKLASYGAATREILSSAEHRQHRCLSNRAENPHQSTRQRNGGCNGLILQATPSGVLRPVAPFHCTYDRGGTSSLSRSIDKG
jgi:transposase-like protein